MQAAACGHFTFRIEALYGHLPALVGYDDKLQRAIDAADPGAVPGGSTITRLLWKATLLSQGC
jgi:hypothetical protein